MLNKRIVDPILYTNLLQSKVMVTEEQSNGRTC